MKLLHGDARELLKTLSPDVVIVDPMHPPRRNTALVKKEMRQLSAIVGPDEDADELMRIALASARESDYHILLAKDLGLITEKEYAFVEARLSEVQGMLMGLRKRVLERVRDARKAVSAKR